MFDARSTPDVQTRPTLSGYDELFDCVLPSYPANRMIAVQKVGEGLIVPLAQPLWCDREKGDEFASFVENIEWLNPGVGRGLVVKAWNGLDWKNTGEDARVLGYASGSLEEIYPAVHG